MRVSCPACNAETSLELLLGREADARAVTALIERHVLFGALLLRYIALFRPAKRHLGIARMVALIEELLPDIERGAINRKGRDWSAPRDSWRAALETVVCKRDNGTLTLPLTTHGLLYEVLASIADKHEGRAEAQHEAERKQRRESGAAHAAPRDLAALAGEIEPGTLPTPALFAAYTQPSRAALEIRARMDASRRAQRGEPEPQQPGAEA